MPVSTARPVQALLDTCPRPWLIGVIHLPALPGAPASRLSMAALEEQACADARLLQDAGFSAVMLENFHDVPFRREQADRETIASMAVLARALNGTVDIPVGINVLRNDALGALAVAVAGGASFVRVNVLAGAAVTDQGLVQGCADELLRRRALLGLQVSVLADVDVKHASSLDRRSLGLRAADLVQRSGADAVLVTGAATGLPCDPAALDEVRAAVDPAPVLAASGTRAETLAAVLAHCDGVLVGTALKDPATGRVSRERAADFLRRRAP